MAFLVIQFYKDFRHAHPELGIVQELFSFSDPKSNQEKQWPSNGIQNLAVEHTNDY